MTLKEGLGGNPGENYQVTGDFSGSFDESASGTTAVNGTVTLQTTETAKGNVNVSFCVDTVSGAEPYDPNDNADPGRLRLSDGAGRETGRGG